MREKEKRTPKENVDGMSTSGHDNKKFRTRSMEKQRRMAFGFRKTTTAVKKYRIERERERDRLRMNGTILPFPHTARPEEG